MAVVYRARRLRIDDEVAVKVLRSEVTLDAVSQVRFEREAQSAARIKHPNIVTIHDFGTSQDGLTYLVMELLNGPTLEDVLSEIGMLSVERAINILLPVCHAIEAAHQEKIIHRDLKPSNIILHRLKDGTELVKVVDFGIVKLGRTSEPLTKVNNLLGTPYYMSPEQCFSREMDARTDIYSLAVICYELLTGRVPFNGQSIVEILQAHVEETPPPPRQIRPDLPAQLESVILRALSKEPEQRPASASQLAQELMSAAGIAPLSASSQSNVKLKTSDMIIAPALAGPRNTGGLRQETINRKFARPTPDFDLFIGRRKEFERLTSEYAQLLQSKARPLVILGDQGIGLTRLGQQFKQWARRQGAAVIMTAFFEPAGRGMAALHTWIDVVRRIVGVPRKDITREGDLAKFVLDKTGIDLPEFFFENRELTEAEKWRGFEVISTVFLRTIGERPAVLIFDNLHFAHGLGLELLSYQLRNFRSRILFIFLGRNEQATQKGHPCQEWLAALARSGGYEMMRLQPFSGSEMRSLVEAIFGRIEIVERDLEHIWQVSRGNPYYIGEILRLLINEGKLALKDEEWVCENIDDFKLPESLNQLVNLKLARLDEPVLELIRQAAVIGNEFTFDLLERVSGQDEDTIMDGLEKAVKEGLIGESQKREDEYHFQDAALRFVLYDAMPRRRRRKLHLQVAQAIEAEAGGNAQKLQRQSERLLHHYHEAGENEKTFHYGRAAAEAARSQMETAKAEQYYAWALAAIKEMEEEEESPPNPMELAELHLGAAEIELILGRLDDADKMLAKARQWADSANDDKMLGRVYLLNSRIEYNRSAFEKALAAAEAGLAAAQNCGDAMVECQLLYLLARTFSALGNTEEALDALECNLEIARQLGDRATESQVLTMLGSLIGAAGNFKNGLAFMEEGLRLARSQKNRIGEMLALRRMGRVYWQCSQLNRALEAYECGLELARTLESRVVEGIFHNGLGEIYFSLGEMDLARDYYQKNLNLSLQIGSQSGEAIANHNLGLVSLELGIIPDAIKMLEKALAQHIRLGELFLTAEAYVGLGKAREQMGLINDARKAYQAAIEHCQRINYPCFAWEGHYGLGSCYWSMGLIDEARVELEKAVDIIEQLREALPDNANPDDFMRDKLKVTSLLNDIKDS